ncbi:MAG: alpha/beta fold hydrolase [Pseudomonadales bacterium]|nr:alpha/beta fold hydrolase [Pseudomonadales bacterium]MCP5184385.1 alpha/beta fold hydrolase [Pseudomonadales bacterium]
MSTHKPILRPAIVTLLLVVLVPPLMSALRPAPDRELQGKRLADVTYREVDFTNATQNIALAGMLFIPAGHAPHPAVVIVHGAGTSRRDNPWYLTLAHDMQQRGFLVLLPDKRGSGRSGGDWRTASFADLATDTQAAIGYLRAAYGDQISVLGVAGMSQGGQVAPLAAARTPAVDFVINVVGSTVPFTDALDYEEVNNLREFGFLPGIADVIAFFSTRYIRFVRQPEFWAANGNWDPLPWWRTMRIPALILYGAADRNTPVAASVARLESLCNPAIRVVVFAGSGHPVEDPPGHGNRIFRQDALDTIGDFIDQLPQPTLPRSAM